MPFNKPISIESWDEDTETWKSFLDCHAAVNKSAGNEYLGSGAEQSTQSKVFEVWWNSKIKAIELNTQLYRILYESQYYDIQDYDDYKDQHLKVKLLGVGRGVTR